MIRTVYPPGSVTGGATKLFVGADGRIRRISMRVLTTGGIVYYAHSSWELLTTTASGKQGGNILKDTSAVQDGKFDWKGDMWMVCDSTLTLTEVDFEAEDQR